MTVVNIPLLEITDLVVSYGYGDVVRGASLRVEEGSLTCIIGPNGAGKSTVLKAISGLIRPRSGAITLRRETSLVGRTPRAILESGVVQVAQDRCLFPKMTVWENVLMGGYILRDRALVKERIESVAERFPIVRERRSAVARTLSGGQQRIVEVARAMMLDPLLVLLDEPTLGLDPRARAQVFDTVESLNADGRTVLMVEQNAKSALQSADYGVVMDLGVVRLVDRAANVLHDPHIGRLYLGASPTTTSHAAPTAANSSSHVSEVE